MSESTPDQVAQPTEARPTPRINVDLDAHERPAHKANRLPYAFNLGGHAIILADPEELDWEEVMLLQDSPQQLLSLAMSRSDARYMREFHVPLWKVAKLAEDYMNYYDVGDKEGNSV